MSNHPNRSSLISAPGRNPTPEELRRARAGIDMTVGAAAALVWSTGNMWAQWECGQRKMHPALWELFCRKTKQDYMFNPDHQEEVTR